MQNSILAEKIQMNKLILAAAITPAIPFGRKRTARPRPR